MHNNFNINRLDLFWRFIKERQSIWNKRFIKKIPSPWTKDSILQKGHFTNIYRELDPGTQYAIKNILELDKSKQDKIFNDMIYRLIGREETFDVLGFQRLNDFNKNEFEIKLKKLRDIEHKAPFTGAYLVSGYSKMDSKDKIENITRLFNKIHKDFNQTYKRIGNSKSSKEVFITLKSLYGFGTFLSYQVLVDLQYPLKCYGNKAVLPFSNNDWAIAGPGAKKGIKILMKQGIKYNELEIMRWLHNNQESEFKRLGLNFPFLKDENNKIIKISLANIQNCLCEFYKYVKIKEGFGRGRRKFSRN